METFYITYDEFWTWFNRQPDTFNSSIEDDDIRTRNPKSTWAMSEPDGRQVYNSVKSFGNKRLKTAAEHKPKNISETEAACVNDRYIIMYGPHKPGKKTKVWEGDGYLTLVGQMAHICDLKGRLLEDPTLLDETDYDIVLEMGELLIGNTEVQVIEKDTS